MSKLAKNSIIVVACPDQVEGKDPEALGLALHQQGPIFVNAFCQAATDLVIKTGPQGHFPTLQISLIQICK